MALPSQSLGSTRYRRRPKSSSSKRRSPLARVLAVAAAIVFVVLAVMLVRSMTGSPADTKAAQPERAQEQPTKPADLAASITTEPRVISSQRQFQTHTPAQTTAQTDADRPDISSATTNPRTTPTTLAAGSPDPSAHDPSQSAQVFPSGAQPPATASGAVASLLARGENLWASNKPVEARDALNRALSSPGANSAQQQAARALIAQINDLLVFSPRVVPGDPLARTYEIQGGDILSRIARDETLRTDWHLLMRINKIADVTRIRVNQRIKMLQGPFHAAIHKAAYRIDFYADTRDSGGNRLYIGSRPCGLGEYDSTPTGLFKVRRDSKLINPHWVNPRTGERFDADNPENPIGERWIGLEGTDSNTSSLLGYGIHGTIDSGSIGGQESMGCIRMLPADVELAYELLVVEYSTVEVLP